MAARDVLDHDALRPFSARVTQLGSVRSAENIAYGYDSFPKTLGQWIDSSGHRYNLLMHGASRVGIASARSAKSGRTYWAMVIAAPEIKQEKRGKDGKAKALPDHAQRYLPVTLRRHARTAWCPPASRAPAIRKQWMQAKQNFV